MTLRNRSGSKVAWEVGGDFALCPLPMGRSIAFPKKAVYYALGRHCVAQLSSVLQKGSRLWVPKFFCHSVTGSWRSIYEVKFYDDDPRDPEPDWRTLSPAPRDIVLAVNYFGCREAKPWTSWRRRVKCCLVEDHSHDPGSPWAVGSTADYAFSSLRKTLPVPDGAVLWSPLGKPLPLSPAAEAAAWVVEKLTAMYGKAEYLRGNGGSELKSLYRRLLTESEHNLDHSGAAPVSCFSATFISRGIPVLWRKQRAANVAFLLRVLSGWRAAKPLFVKWPAGASPLGLVLAFRSRAERDNVRKLMNEHNIYCPIHWEDVNGVVAEDHLSTRILTIPADQRYTTPDMKRIAKVLLREQKSKKR